MGRARGRPINLAIQGPLNLFALVFVEDNVGCAGEAKMKRLYRSRKNRVIAGVCGGIGEYLEVDPVLIRIIAVFLLFAGGGSLIAYILGIIIIPDQPRETIQDAEPTPHPATSPGNRGNLTQSGGLIVGGIMVVLGMFFLLRTLPWFHRYYWWFWDMGWRFFWPSILIAIGLLVIIRAASNRSQ